MTARGEGCERSDTGPEDRSGESTCWAQRRRAAYKRLLHAVGARADQQDSSNAPLQLKRSAADSPCTRRECWDKVGLKAKPIEQDHG